MWAERGVTVCSVGNQVGVWCMQDCRCIIWCCFFCFDLCDCVVF